MLYNQPKQIRYIFSVYVPKSHIKITTWRNLNLTKYGKVYCLEFLKHRTVRPHYMYNDCLEKFKHSIASFNLNMVIRLDTSFVISLDAQVSKNIDRRKRDLIMS